MYIKIHRGCHQIGGNIIEIGTDKTKAVFDIGSNLPPLDEEKPSEDLLNIKGFTTGTPEFSAVFISHHHADHSGLASDVLSAIPVYVGVATAHILDTIAVCINKEKLSNLQNFTHLSPINLNDMKITPIITKHSAKDAYMFLIEGDGKTILYYTYYLYRFYLHKIKLNHHTALEHIRLWAEDFELVAIWSGWFENYIINKNPKMAENINFIRAFNRYIMCFSYSFFDDVKFEQVFEQVFEQAFGIDRFEFDCAYAD